MKKAKKALVASALLTLMALGLTVGVAQAADVRVRVFPPYVQFYASPPVVYSAPGYYYYSYPYPSYSYSDPSYGYTYTYSYPSDYYPGTYYYSPSRIIIQPQ